MFIRKFEKFKMKIVKEIKINLENQTENLLFVFDVLKWSLAKFNYHG